MTLSQKRTCNGCYALVRLNKLNFCSMSYKTSVKSVEAHMGDKPYFHDDVCPLEPCPKPITYRQYVQAWNDKWKRERQGR